MSLSLGMTPIKEVKGDLQFVVPVPFSQACEPRMSGEGRVSPAVQHRASARLLQLPVTVGVWGNVCLLCWQRRSCGVGASLLFHEGIVHSHDFKAVMIQRESLPRVKLKHALCASANAGISVQGVLWRKVVSSEQTRSYKVL